jgi:hypothetical protein
MTDIYVFGATVTTYDHYLVFSFLNDQAYPYLTSMNPYLGRVNVKPAGDEVPCESLVVAGGGSGQGGGGSAGQLLEGPETLTGNMPVVVGWGGVSMRYPLWGSPLNGTQFSGFDGGQSSFGSRVCAPGVYGGCGDMNSFDPIPLHGHDGWNSSGGGASFREITSEPGAPSGGHSGGHGGGPSVNYAGGGGGGAGGDGGDALPSMFGAGGIGVLSSLRTGSPVGYAGGGWGGEWLKGQGQFCQHPVTGMGYDEWGGGWGCRNDGTPMEARPYSGGGGSGGGGNFSANVESPGGATGIVVVRVDISLLAPIKADCHHSLHYGRGVVVHG